MNEKKQTLPGEKNQGQMAERSKMPRAKLAPRSAAEWGTRQDPSLRSKGTKNV